MYMVPPRAARVASGLVQGFQCQVDVRLLAFSLLSVSLLAVSLLAVSLLARR
jgi:hypothetical protein